MLFLLFYSPKPWSLLEFNHIEIGLLGENFNHCLIVQVVQSGGKNIELAVMRKGETLKVNTIIERKEFL